MYKKNKIITKQYSSRLNKELDKVAIVYDITPTELIRGLVNHEIEYYKITDPTIREQYIKEINDITSITYNSKLDNLDNEIKNIELEKDMIIHEINQENERHDKIMNHYNKQLDKKEKTLNEKRKIYDKVKEASDNYSNHILEIRHKSIKNVFEKVIYEYFINKDIFNESTIQSIIDNEYEYIHLPRIHILNYIQDMLRENENEIIKVNDYKNRNINCIELTKNMINDICSIIGNCK